MSKVSKKKRKSQIKKRQKRSKQLNRIKKLYKLAKGPTDKSALEEKLIKYNPSLSHGDYLKEKK